MSNVNLTGKKEFDPLSFYQVQKLLQGGHENTLEVCDIKTSLNFLFDLHGVLEAYPLLFRPILKSLRCTKHHVFIASGSLQEKLNKELYALGYKEGIHYDKAIGIPDYLISLGIPVVFDENQRAWTDEKTWWSSKAMVCSEFNIDLMIDDSLQYKEYIFTDTKFMLM